MKYEYHISRLFLYQLAGIATEKQGFPRNDIKQGFSLIEHNLKRLPLSCFTTGEGRYREFLDCSIKFGDASAKGFESSPDQPNEPADCIAEQEKEITPDEHI